jgi:BirA family transcriptional regulator, biotin operon repressor / biotin---[acetyl-CoA-carboxylase] ligase
MRPKCPGRATACLADAGVARPRPRPSPAPARASTAGGANALEGLRPIRAAWLPAGRRSARPWRSVAAGSRIAGRFAGLAEDGSLLLEPAGRVVAVASGEVGA